MNAGRLVSLHAIARAQKGGRLVCCVRAVALGCEPSSGPPPASSAAAEAAPRSSGTSSSATARKLERQVAAAAWHHYRFEARGDRLLIYWDGDQVLDHRDGTFAEAARVGRWTKAHAISCLDDLTVGELM